MRRPLRWLLEFAAPPVVLFFVVIAIWHLAVVAMGIKRYVVPQPLEVLRAGWERRGDLLSAASTTGEAAAAGFLLSLAAGFMIACLFSQSRVVERSIYPYAIFLQTVPIVAIAPLIVAWFGYGFQSVVVVAFIISIFPVITNATAGLTAIDANLLELFELAGASRWQLLVKLRLPSSVPHVVTGARISAGLSVVGAIVGEIFAGAGAQRPGLGYLIQQTTGFQKTADLFAAVIVSAALGMVIFGTVSAAGAAVMKCWRGD
ncbi:MAG TPA: ABC transporter permease [Pirellulales bacterium]|nr:ABC transporter permease [Pirellulales bacterium]